MIIAIDPGNIESAYVLMDDNYKPIAFGKYGNESVLSETRRILYERRGLRIVIEMVSSYGMPVGKEVFDTCVWIGRFYGIGGNEYTSLIFRKDVKLNLCGQAKAKDSNIIQALKDRFGGKGTRKSPGWFYGFKADCWQAYALGVTYLDQKKAEADNGTKA